MARGTTPVQHVTDSALNGRGVSDGQQKRICMHVQSPAITDPRVMREATALAEANYHVTIVDIEHHQRPKSETVDGVRLKHVFVSPKSAQYYNPVRSLPWLVFKVTRTLRSALKVIGTPADAYHAHDITAFPACYVAASLRRKPLVFDAHELPLTQRHLLERPKVTGVSRALLRLMMRRCHAAITVSPPLIGEMQALYGGPRATLVRNVPDYQAPAQGDLLRQHFGFPPATRIALYQGYFQGNRSLDVLARAAQYLAPGNVIVLLGEGSHRAMVEALIAELGVEDRIKIKGYVPHAELLSWTASADLGLSVFSRDISISTRYCLPNKLFEYLMAGLPVLTTPLDAVVELVRRYEVGWEIDDMEPETVATAINRMLADPGELARMRANALTACQRDLRWDVEKDALVGLYRGTFAQEPHAIDAASSKGA
ncbi:MAG TPA: glycosyltransferase family 4 protein [Ktedonobacterales bacterium]